MAKNNAPKRRKPVSTQVYGSALSTVTEKSSSSLQAEKITNVGERFKAVGNGSAMHGIVKLIAKRCFAVKKNNFGEENLVGEIVDSGNAIYKAVFDKELERCINSRAVLRFFVWFLTKFAESDKKTTDFNFSLRALEKDCNLKRSSAYELAKAGTGALYEMDFSMEERSAKRNIGWKRFRFFPAMDCAKGIISITLSREALEILKEYTNIYILSSVLALSTNIFPHALVFTLLCEIHRKNSAKTSPKTKDILTVRYLYDCADFPIPSEVNYEYKKLIIEPFVRNMDATEMPWRLLDNVGRPVKRYEGKDRTTDLYLEIDIEDFLQMRVQTIHPLEAEKALATGEGKTKLLGFYRGLQKNNRSK